MLGNRAWPVTPVLTAVTPLVSGAGAPSAIDEMSSTSATSRSCRSARHEMTVVAQPARVAGAWLLRKLRPAIAPEVARLR
jgi:hypothetical protein